MKSTNYFNTFIQVAEDCPAESGEVPPLRGNKKSAARIQYEMISEQPYTYTSDDILFSIHAGKKKISDEQLEKEREAFFSKGRACLRASALGKRYGWGLHFNDQGKIALYGVGTDKYQTLAEDPDLNNLKAMRSSRR